jgi:hypothetical protein
MFASIEREVQRAQATTIGHINQGTVGVDLGRVASLKTLLHTK